MSDYQTIEELRQKGIDALVDDLGPVGMARFIRSYQTGSGNYTRNRKEWLSDDIDSIAGRIRQSRNDNNQENPDLSQDHNEKN